MTLFLWPAGNVAEWVRALACIGDRTVQDGFESHCGVKCGQLRFGTLEIPFTPLCQCFSDETLKIGPFYLVAMALYARGSNRSHQSALECVTVMDSTTHSKLPTSRVRLCGGKRCPALLSEEDFRRRRTL